ncbi:MAG: flippase-like domain-containing protein [Planctomycetaceae bacterium]|jgi:uncharacterized membrane protein YbhN (UPF0104 family)|nr:flippase-like domain-containing protein [Planctomycetaceae bacterium]
MMLLRLIQKNSVRRFFWIFLQIVLIVCIFGFLFWKAAAATDAGGRNILAVFWEQPKRWHLLAAAFAAQFLAVSLTLIRWRWLTRTLGLECSYKDAFRIGFLGAMLNLMPLGIVGGDAVKAVMITQKNSGYKSQSVAGVFLDRFIGLLGMFLCGTVLILLTGFHLRHEMAAETLTRIVFFLTACSVTGSAVVFLPFFAKGHFERRIEKIPFAGGPCSKLTRSLLLYRHHKRCLLQSCLVSVGVHLLLGLSLYWLAAGLFPVVPGLTEHEMLYCAANLTSMIPLAAGPFEFVLAHQLYPLFGTGIGAGLVIALAYRLTTILVAVAGAVAAKILF